MTVSRDEVLSTGAMQLIAYFDHISEAPDAIPRLRRFVLDLAVRGKLVQQDASADKPPIRLLKGELEVEQSYSRTSATKDSVPTRLGIDVPERFPLPGGWILAPLRSLCISITDGDHLPPPKTTHGIPFLVIGNVRTQRLDFVGCRYVSEDYFQQLDATRRPQRGDILYTLVGSYGIPILVTEDRPFCVQRHIGILRPSPFVDTAFLMRALESDFVLNQASQCATGIAQKTVPLGGLRRIVIPFPPLAEQHRIVAKVDELMALCDRLEAAQAERERRRDPVITASLQRLGPSPSRPDHRYPEIHLRKSVGLIARRDHIEEVRQTILDFAVRGWLVSQEPVSDPASEELAKIDALREAIARADRRADATQQALLAADDRWDVPASWEWRGLADLALFIDYRGQTPLKTADGVRLITAKNVKSGFINLSPDEFISEEGYRLWMTRGFPAAGDVLFTTEAPLGNAAVVRLDERFALAQRVICLRRYGAMNPDFLVLQLLSEPFRTILNKTATGLTAKGIKAAKLKRLPIAIPPVSEQNRIVAKVAELIALCDRLEAWLTTAQTERSRLLEAVLHRALWAAYPERALRRARESKG